LVHPIEPVETDENGRFQLPEGINQIVLLAEHDGQAVSNLREFYTYRQRDDRPDSAGSQTVFFTDRALYVRARQSPTRAFPSAAIKAPAITPSLPA